MLQKTPRLLTTRGLFTVGLLTIGLLTIGGGLAALVPAGRLPATPGRAPHVRALLPRPAVATPAPPREADPFGDPSRYLPNTQKALDPVYDGKGERASEADIMAFYADEEVDCVRLRVDLARPGFPHSGRVSLDNPAARVTVLLDYAPGGRTDLPDVGAGAAPFGWERAVTLSRDASGALAARLDGDAAFQAAWQADPGVEPLRGAGFAPNWDMAEVVLTRPAGLPGDAAAALAESTPIRYYVYTSVAGVLEDEVAATNLAASPTAAHNVAFVQHGNQGLTYTTVFRGERGESAAYDGDPNNPDDGFDELMAAHDYYDLPGNFHLAATLQTAAEWHDPGFNDWLITGVSAGWAQMVTSAFAQHIMPFFTYNMNSWAVDRERDMTNWRYGGDAVVAWVPERVWLDNPDNDGNGTTASAGVIDWIGSSFVNNGVQAVILDDYIHCGYQNTAFNDNHIYTLGNGLKVIPINNNFVGEVNYDYGNAWNRIINSSADELIVYGNDWEFCAEVSQGAGNAFALNNYIEILRRCSMNSATVGVWKINDTLGGFGGGPIALQNGTYGLLGGHGGYGGGNNSWYGSWAGYVGPSNSDGHAPKWNYGTQWTFAYNKLITVPVNNISEGAWYVLMTNLHESGWHDNGEVSGWQHKYSNKVKNANAHAEAARWAGGLYGSPTGAYLSDFDDDGVQEAVIYNDRVLAVFESIGGKAQWIFAKGADYNYSVVSNDNVYWPDTDGDYNDNNHVAGLSDVSVGGVNRENDLYALNVVTGSGTTVELELTHANLEKRIRLTAGQPFLDVVYNTSGDRAYIKGGFTPDLVDLTWNAGVTRVWDPDGVSNNAGYFGWKNPRTNATGAIVVGGVAGANGGGSFHNLDYTRTLLGVDEWYGDGAFEFYVFAGYTSALDGQGHVPELKALRDGLHDFVGPDVVRASYYPSQNRLSIRFNQVTKYNNIVKTSIAIDSNDDGIANLTLTSGETVLNTSDALQIDFTLTNGTATALEALPPGTLELLLQPGAVTDPALNGNLLVTNLDNRHVDVQAATKVVIDGRIDPVEWVTTTRIVNDPGDSQWTSANEIDALHICWDATYLYLAVDGQVSGNSWILYVDTDFGGPNGQTNLTATNAWERGATFTRPGFKPDLAWGTYQHQGPFDGSSLFRLTGPTTTDNLSSSALFGIDTGHSFGGQSGTEIAIPWDAIYGLGPNHCPASTQVAIVASICWDPEPNGELGGDIAPNNPVGTNLPVVGSCYNLYVDLDGNGEPDPDPQPSAVPELPGPDRALVALHEAMPNPFNPVTRIVYEIDAAAGTGRIPLTLRIFDVNGRSVATLVSGAQAAGRHEVGWDGRGDDGTPAPSGIYFAQLEARGQKPQTIKLSMIK